MLLGFRGSWKTAALESAIRSIDPNQDVSRAAFSNRALLAAEEVTNWHEVRASLMALEHKEELTVPSFVQVNIENEALYKEIKEAILREFEGELQVLQVGYFFQLIWANYLQLLRRRSQNSEVISQEEDLSGVELISRLSRLLLSQSEANKAIVEQIKTLLSR